jgi:hypothetical protein
MVPLRNVWQDVVNVCDVTYLGDNDMTHVYCLLCDLKLQLQA